MRLRHRVALGLVWGVTALPILAAPSPAPVPSSTATATPASSATPTPSPTPEPTALSYGAPRPFSYDTLVAQARELSTQDYHAPEAPDHSLVDQIDYLQHGRIHYKPESVLWVGAKKALAVSFFHLGRLFNTPVDISVVDKGMARPLIVPAGAFDIPDDSPAARMKTDNRVAGFKIQEEKGGKLDWHNNDWLSFLGASYFRSIGELYQYGLSARGLAVNPANPDPPFTEEFPAFRSFWLESLGDSPTSVTIYALLDGPSVTGAYRFDIERKAKVIMKVESTLFLRKDIARLGIAPLTSMYWYSETARPAIIDWRPEVHDSDGLAIDKGNGEALWRPLNNPPRVRISSFLDEKPKGFGLMQRDRSFRDYLEDGAYERRPSLWVEPLGDWGQGSVQLLEIPTVDESEDNIVAFWVPATPATKGSELHFQYRLTWAAEQPNPPNVAPCIATRLVREPMKRWPADVQKFIVEFAGGPLAKLPADAKMDIDLSASKGICGDSSVQQINADGQLIWRVKFSLSQVPDAEPVELRLALKKDGKPLTETWLYQLNP